MATVKGIQALEMWTAKLGDEVLKVLSGSRSDAIPRSFSEHDYCTVSTLICPLQTLAPASVLNLSMIPR